MSVERIANEGTPFVLAGSASYSLRSPEISDTLKIDISVPFEYNDSDRHYPIVYIVDGYWYFPIVSQIARLLEIDGELPPVIVVGIGYEPKFDSPRQEEERVTNLRCRELTPTRDDTDWWVAAANGKPLGVGIETGHSAEFARVIDQEIKPLVATRYRTNSDHTIAGFSLGGLFALDMLFRSPGIFSRFIAGSPSLWWGDSIMFKFEQRYAAANTDLAKRVFLSMGGLEGAACGMVLNFHKLTATLTSRRYPSLRLGAALFDNETHSSVVAATFVRGLREVFRP